MDFNEIQISINPKDKSLNVQLSYVNVGSVCVNVKKNKWENSTSIIEKWGKFYFKSKINWSYGCTQRNAYFNATINQHHTKLSVANFVRDITQMNEDIKTDISYLIQVLASKQ